MIVNSYCLFLMILACACLQFSQIICLRNRKPAIKKNQKFITRSNSLGYIWCPIWGGHKQTDQDISCSVCTSHLWQGYVLFSDLSDFIEGDSSVVANPQSLGKDSVLATAGPMLKTGLTKIVQAAENKVRNSFFNRSILHSPKVLNQSLLSLMAQSVLLSISELLI